MQSMAVHINTKAITTAGLGISATTTRAKIGAADFYATVGGRLLKIVASTDMPVLVGSVTNARFNVYCFFVDASGTVTSAMGTESATLGGVRFPDFPLGRALIGFVIVNPTGTGPFIGGTTPLGDATVVPNAVYISTFGSVDPTFLFS
jgi:hypothetical protein